MRGKIMKWTKSMRSKSGIQGIQGGSGTYGGLCTLLQKMVKSSILSNGDADGRPFGPHTAYLLAPPVVEPQASRVTAVLPPAVEPGLINMLINMDKRLLSV